MADRQQRGTETLVSHRGAARVAVIGAGIAGLTCARDLAVRGYEPVVFEASDRVGGRCGARPTRVGWFDDAAQMIKGNTRLAAYAAPEPGRLAASHAWTMADAPVDTERNTRDTSTDENDAAEMVSLHTLGMVGVPSMASLVNAIAKPLEVRLNTPVFQAHRHHASWVLQGETGEMDEDFQAMVVAVPAPIALPLVMESASLSLALRGVHYRSRWVLLLGTERTVLLPNHREFAGGPIERIAAMHSKPGQAVGVSQRWFIEASERWSMDHAQDDAETVADLLLSNFSAHARRSVAPNFLLAHHWEHAFVDAPAPLAQESRHLWDERLLLGVCGDSVVASRVDHVHRSGALMAARLDESLMNRRWRSAPAMHNRAAGPTFERVPAPTRLSPHLMGTA